MKILFLLIRFNNKQHYSMFGWSCQIFLAASGSLCSLRDTGSFLSIRVSREGSREDNCGGQTANQHTGLVLGSSEGAEEPEGVPLGLPPPSRNTSDHRLPEVIRQCGSWSP